MDIFYLFREGKEEINLITVLNQRNSPAGIAVSRKTETASRPTRFEFTRMEGEIFWFSRGAKARLTL